MRRIVSLHRVKILRYINKNTNLPIVRISRKLNVSYEYLHKLLFRWKILGLISFVPLDGKSRTVVLTDKGKKILEKVNYIQKRLK